MKIVDVEVQPIESADLTKLGAWLEHLDDAPLEVRVGEIVEEPMEVTTDGDKIMFVNHAVGDDDVVCDLEDGKAIVTFFNYHGDATQAFISADREPTIFLVAPPSETPRPEDFVALYSDGRYGLAMRPDVWHTTPLPVSGNGVFDNKQGNQYFERTVGHTFVGVAVAVTLKKPER